MAGRFTIEAVFKAVDNFVAPISKMQSRMQRFTAAAERGIKDLDKASGRWLRGLQTTAKAAAVATTLATAGLAAAAKPGMDFEQQMANLGATSLQTRDQIAALEKEAMRLGAATQYSATEVGAAMENMAKAGFTNEQILSGVAGMIYAASAAGEDLAATTETVSSVMKGMGLEIKESTRVADVLALASVRTNSSIGSLGESMAKVSSTARQLRVPLEDTVAMVALLQDVGLDASEAGSATATMLTMMSKPSKKAAEMMRKMGVSFKDAAGNMKAPTQVLQELVKAGEKAGGNMDQVAFFAELVGLRGQKAAVNLKDLFKAGKVTGLTDELKQAAGTAQKMADLRMNTLTGDLDVFTEGIKGMAIDLESMASGPLREVVQGMSKWVDENGKLMTSGIGDFAKTVADNFGEIALWGKRIGIIVGVITAAAAATKLWAAGVALVNILIAMNPIALVAMAVVGAIALILAFWPEISKFFVELWEGVKDIAARVADSVVSVVKAIWEPVKNFIMSVFKFYVGAWTLILRPLFLMLKPAFDLLAHAAQLVIDNWGPITEFFEGIWKSIKEGVVAFFTTIGEYAVAAFELFKEIWMPIVDVFAVIWDGVKQGFMVVFDFIAGKLEWVAGVIQSAVRYVSAVGDETIGALTGGASDPSVISPQDRVARSISESTTTSAAEVTIRDTTGTATMTKKPSGAGSRIRLQPTGAFR